MDGAHLILLYIDAGSLGYIIQMGLAAAGGAVVYALIFWRRLSEKITSMFTRKNSESPTPGETGTKRKDTPGCD